VKLCLRDSLARLYSHPQHKRVVKNTHADVTSTIIRRDDHTNIVVVSDEQPPTFFVQRRASTEQQITGRRTVLYCRRHRRLERSPSMRSRRSCLNYFRCRCYDSRANHTLMNWCCC